MRAMIVGGGIAGLSLALNLHRHGMECDVYEAATTVREIGVGITILPHAMRELSRLGLQERLVAGGIVNEVSAFFNRYGQLIYQERRGRGAGYTYPEVGIHRARLHGALWDAAVERLGAERLHLDHRCIGFEQDAKSVTLRFQRGSDGETLPPLRAEVVLGCDGVNSAIRRTLYPAEQLVFSGVNAWRGVTRYPPILGGRTYMRIGSIKTAKLILYPIADKIDDEGRQLINWSTERTTHTQQVNDWNKPGRLEDFIASYESWRFDWLDVPDLMRKHDLLLEYPMVDRDPLARWSFGRVTLVGDAAHPMYPRGSNGSAQALIDARVLAERLSQHADPCAALEAYETLRRDATSRVVLTNRSTPPDIINIRVEELTGDRPFSDLNQFITQAELKALSDDYKRIAGFEISAVNESP